MPCWKFKAFKAGTDAPSSCDEGAGAAAGARRASLEASRPGAAAADEAATAAQSAAAHRKPAIPIPKFEATSRLVTSLDERLQVSLLMGSATGLATKKHVPLTVVLDSTASIGLDEGSVLIGIRSRLASWFWIDLSVLWP